MGLIDKFKNMFTEEVEVEEPIKKEVTQVEIPAPSKKKEIKDTVKELVNENVSQEVKEELPLKEEKEEEKFSFPVFFDDEDFKEIEKPKKQEEKVLPVREKKYNEKTYREAYRNDQKEKELYQGNSSSGTRSIYKKEEPRVFKPTPIISPIYGVLDKNYRKEDITTKNDIKIGKTVKPTEMTVDDIRKKAYGTLEDDLENNLIDHKTKEKEEVTDLFEEFEAEPEEKLPSREEKNKDVGNLVEEEINAPHDDALIEEDLFNLINAMYEEKEEEN